jgi:aminomethyltransferase
VALERGIPRPGMLVTLVPDVPLCEVTSGTFSPTLRKGIGMALVPTFVDPEAELGVQVRTRREIFASATLPFVDTSVREA